MRLESLLTKMCDSGEKYDIAPNKIYQLIEFQDFKRVYRGGKGDIELSLNVIDRFLRTYKRT